jgi:dethiobiotin synthetase
VAAAICAALHAGGRRVAAWKPVVTGLDEDPESGWPHDHELLALAAGAGDAAEVAPHTFGPAVSPHLAAELAGREIDPAELARSARRAAEGADALIVEGVGGLLVPLTREHCVRDLARELELPVVIAARPGLGTINHTLLTVSAARAAGLEARAVVLTPWPKRPSAMESSNRETIAELGDIEVAVLGRLADARPATLARAGAALPLASWLA